MSTSTIRQLNRWVFSLVSIAGVAVPSAVLPIGAGTAGAAPSGPTMVTLSTIFRRCDHSAADYVPGRGTGRGFALISSTASGEAVADIRFETGRPDTRYLVTLIQTPRPASRTCVGGDPGATGGALDTDAGGNGNVTLRAPIQPGATGAWVSILLPPEDPPPVIARLGSPHPNIAQIYTSDFLAPI